MRMIIRLTVVVTALLAFSVYGIAADSETGADTQRAVLVTGASTGIGRKIAEVLAEQGHFVYAGARKQADIDALNEETVGVVCMGWSTTRAFSLAVHWLMSTSKNCSGLWM